MGKISFYIVYIFIFCSCNTNTTNTGLMDPIEELSLGMRKGKALSIIDFYKDENIIDENGMVSIAGNQAEISFIFCRDCFGYWLEGVTLKSSNRENLYQKLKLELADKNYTLKKQIIRSPTSVIPDPSDTLICIYTNKVVYEERGVIRCKITDYDPCWGDLFKTK